MATHARTGRQTAHGHGQALHLRLAQSRERAHSRRGLCLPCAGGAIRAVTTICAAPPSPTLWMEDEMFRRCLFLGLAFLLLLALPARAADKAWEDCGQPIDQDRKIAGCTTILARGAAESETNRANAYVNRGYAYGTRDVERAIKDYDAAIGLDPKVVRAYNARARAYTMKGEFDRAITDLDEAIRLDPN